jgi:hypothetical protein
MAFSSRKAQIVPPPAQPQPLPQPGAFNQPATPPAVTLSSRTLLYAGIVGVALIIILVLALVIFSKGCPECKPGLCDQSAVCSKDTNYQCQRTPKLACDIQLESKKAACSGPVAGSKLLVKKFNVADEQCYTDMDPKAVVTQLAPFFRVSGGGISFRVTPKYGQPFNAAKDEITLEILPENEPAGTQNLIVTKVELDGQDAKKQSIVLGETTPAKPLPSTTTPGKVMLRLTPIDDSGTATNLKFLIDIAYSQVTSGTVQDKTGRVTVTMPTTQTLVWVKPSFPYTCADNAALVCDDKDPSTRDFCDPNDAPFCKHEPISGACGNGQCEAGESKCSCPQDCGICGGSFKVTGAQCEGTECVIKLLPSVVVQPVNKVEQKNLVDATISSALQFNSPFSATGDTLNVVLTLDERADTLDSLRIDSVDVFKAGTNLIDSATLNKPLVVVGNSVTATLHLKTAQIEESMTPTVKVTYTITAKGKTDQRDYTQTMPAVTVYGGG